MPSYKKSDSRAYCKENMKGIWAAIPYPFDENDNIDEAGFFAPTSAITSTTSISRDFSSVE